MSEQVKWELRPQSYRRGYVEAMDGRGPNVYLLEAGAPDSEEYWRGYADGREQRANDLREWGEE